MTGLAAASAPRVAARISAWCEPRRWMLAAAPLVGWHADGVRGGVWGLLAAVLTGVVPPLCITIGVRRRRWGGGLTERRDRLAAAPWILAPLVAGAVALPVLGAPRELTALVVAMTAVLLALAAITTVWKVSAHSAVAAGASAVLVLTYGSWLLPLTAVVGATAWSRLRLGRHTPAQVVVGVTVGAAVAGTVFTLLR